MTDLYNPIFNDEEAARSTLRLPAGPMVLTARIAASSTA